MFEAENERRGNSPIGLVRRGASHAGLYLFFGVCTTGVNLVLFLLLFRLAGWPAWLANAAAWWPSVVLAWGTNRLWVFDAPRGLSVGTLAGELAVFTGSRVLTGALDVALIWLTVDVAHWHELAMKVWVGVIVTLTNYGAGRWVFRARKEAMR